MPVDPSAATTAEPGRASPDAGPRTLGKYRLDRVIGEGGMGIVWAALDPDLERQVALKVLRSDDTDSPLRTRLLREARAMARLKHPNVLVVYEVGTDHNRDFIAMELVDGSDLDAWLETQPPRAEIVDALLAAGRGLAAAHAASLVHRDFKPHNVLRSRDGHVYVTDFGLARGQLETGVAIEQRPLGVAADAPPRRPTDAVLDTPLTQTGVLIGTPAYMAPEQFAGKTPDARTDQFAFCVTAWEALTGSRPFRGADLAELEAAAGQGVGGVSADLPARVRAVLARGLEPDPDRRWPDLPTLLGELSAAFGPAHRPRRRWLIAAILGGAAAIAGGITIVQLQGSSSAEGTCVPGTVAFEEAWGAEHRSALSRAHGGEAIAATVLLDEMRRQWLESYEAACAAPDTAEIRARIGCLLRARDDVARVTARLSRADGPIDEARDHHRDDRSSWVRELAGREGIRTVLQHVQEVLPETSSDGSSASACSVQDRHAATFRTTRRTRSGRRELMYCARALKSASTSPRSRSKNSAETCRAIRAWRTSSSAALTTSATRFGVVSRRN